MNKKGIVSIFLGLLILVLILWLATISWGGGYGCKTDAHCNDNQYCGVDRACHNIPIIEKEVPTIIEQKDYGKPAWILGVAAVVVAFILRWEKIFPKKK